MSRTALRTMFRAAFRVAFRAAFVTRGLAEMRPPFFVQGLSLRRAMSRCGKPPVPWRAGARSVGERSVIRRGTGSGEEVASSFDGPSPSLVFCLRPFLLSPVFPPSVLASVCSFSLLLQIARCVQSCVE